MCFRIAILCIKEELLVFAAAMNLITVVTNMPCDPISFILIYIST